MMNKYYIKIAIRNLIKYKSYFLISVFGLAIGMAVCIMLLLYVQNEFSYDRYNKNADKIYRLCQPKHAYHSPQTAKILADGIPEIKDYAEMLVMGRTIIQYEEEKYKESSIIMATPSLFNLFSFKYVYGGPETALKEPMSMVISETIAKKYFGDINPLGKVVRADNESDYTISAVIKDMPNNSHFRYDIFLTLVGTEEMFGDWANNWGWENFLIYFLIEDEFSPSDLEARFGNLIEIHKKESRPDDPKTVYVIQKLKDIHLYSSYLENDIQPQNSITYVLIFSAIGILILLIACFNYINLLTANAASRIKEIGIKKVVGATRFQLSGQFMGESFVLLFFSFFLSLIVVEIALPGFNQLLGKEIPMSALIKPGSLLGMLGIFLITGLLAGSYPAFFLSSLQPVKILKGSGTVGQNKSYFRRTLVIAQFVIVIALLSSAIIMVRQISFLKNKELGFDKGNILVSEFGQFSNVEKYLSFKQQLLGISVIKEVSAASRVPSGSLNNFGGALPQGQTDSYGLPFVHVSFDYFQALDVRAIQGRVFSKDFQTDISEAIVLNREAIKFLGIEGDPIGQMIQCTWPKSNRKIIGVVEDFHFESLYNKIRPIAFVILYRQCEQLMIKTESPVTDETVKMINDVCGEFYPELMFEFSQLDGQVDQIYQSDKRTFQLMGFFTAIAVLIACIGLFGLASFMLKNRIKEIGMRKIFGASLVKIITILSGDYARWVLVSSIIGWPIAWYVMKRWLESFAYKIDIGVGAFLVAGFSALLLALATVCWLSWGTAKNNPVDALRYE
jgi:putative ABC transport system permease protein